MADTHPSLHERLRQVDPKLVEDAVERSNRALERLQTLAERLVQEALQSSELDQKNSPQKADSPVVEAKPRQEPSS